MENFNQLFANLDTQASILILSWLIIAFLLGLLAGYFLRNRYVKELTQQLEDKEQQLLQLKPELEQTQQELALKEADLKRAAFEAEEAQSTIRRANEEIGRLNQLVGSAQVELDKAKYAEQTSASIINDLNDQILGLKTRIAQLQEGTGITEPILTDTGRSDSNIALDRLAGIESQLARLTEENQALLRKLGENVGEENPFENRFIRTTVVQTIEETPAAVETAGEFFVPKVVVATEPVAEVTNLGSDSSTLMNTDKVLLRNVEKNDLTAIEGIGPFLEKKLNDAGVFTYADIAAWDTAKITAITQQISFFEGRIEKDDWVGQAKKLLGEKSSGSAAVGAVADARDLSVAAAEIVVPKDNLKLILGIDEAIEKVFHLSGIQSFAELAKMEPNEIRNILVVVDPALSSKDPSAWPAQARLASDQEWEVLQDYQEQLKQR
ncbi:helix-hairpin-helix domain-containing protein [Haliscomenobacter sp.]|uniref:helix-hairpin-helix domain-containing protein n=1 Tax=Haliscomenobacter sp. TaxID=2717303 RepID=UPI0033652A0F